MCMVYVVCVCVCIYMMHVFLCMHARNVACMHVCLYKYNAVSV